jgi:hypothetical protein
MSAEEANYVYDADRPDYFFENAADQAAYEFKQGSVSAAGLAAKAHQELIKICMSDASKSETRKKLIQTVVLKWIEPLREISNEVAVNTVEIAPWNSSDCDAYVAVGNYNPAYANMGKTPKVHIAKSGWFGSSTVTLHEFGHAFGLLDTYNGRGGSCQPGQPGSVMCYAKYDELLEDDRLGVQSVYRAVFKNR